MSVGRNVLLVYIEDRLGGKIVEPTPLTQPQLNQLLTILTTVLSSIGPAERGPPFPMFGHSTLGHAEAILPSREEFEHIREIGIPLYTTILLSDTGIVVEHDVGVKVTVAYPHRFTIMPFQVSWREKLASLVADLVLEHTGFTLSRAERTQIGDNGRIGLPSREALEQVLSGRSLVYSLLYVTASPYPFLVRRERKRRRR